jgi:ABC-type sugar transport system ATPase subunit
MSEHTGVPDGPTMDGECERTPLLQLQDIHRRFGGVRALNGARLTLNEPGTVQGLIGENGSGKSTLLGVLSGQLQPDSGRILIDGQATSLTNPRAALDRGIAMVSQENAVALDLTVAENILLGRRLVRRRGAISWQATRNRAADILERLNLDYDPDAPVRTLRPDQRQMVEIARALSLETRVLILDEPTSSLSDDEVVALFAAVRQLKSAGVTTVFVSHRISELFEICDEITVLRDGMTVGSGPKADYSRDSLVELMVGARESAAPRRTHDSRGARTVAQSDVALAVEHLSVEGAVRDVSFDVHAGEVVGIAGLVGAGRSELLEAIFGSRHRSDGVVSVCGDHEPASTPRSSIAKGLGFLPPDRKEQGVLLKMDIRDNALMVLTHRHARLKVPRPGRHESRLRSAAKSLNLRYATDARPVSSLSGGNQQKVALAKWIVDTPRVLLLDEPTRGVDVSSKNDIHAMLRTMAADGSALLVSSSENDELLDLCDRIIVMSRGSVVAVVTVDDVDEAKLTSLAGGHS